MSLAFGPDGKLYLATLIRDLLSPPGRRPALSNAARWPGW